VGPRFSNSGKDSEVKRLDTEQVGDVTVVCFLDAELLSNDEEWRVELFALIDSGALKMVCDFTNVKFLTSESLGSLLLIKKTLSSQGGRLVLCELNDLVRQIFLPMPNHWANTFIFEGRAEAVRELGGSP
jgi:anti-anti-sigma factor